MKKFLLSAAFAVPFMMNAQVASEDFESYVAGDLLTEVGAANGWREWGVANGSPTAGYSAQVTDLSASSGTLAGRSASDVTIESDAIWTWTDVTAGKYSITMKLYLPAGTAGGYIGIGDSDMDGAGTQPNALYIMGDSLLVMGDDASYFAQAPLMADTWMTVEMIIDIDGATAELLVDGMSYGVGGAAYTSMGVGLGGLDLWGTQVDIVSGDYNPGDYYYDDFAVTAMSSAGIDKITAMSLNVATNPSNGEFAINFNDYAFDNAAMTITNMMGAVVYIEALSSVSNSTQNFDLDLNSGVYVVRVADNSNEFSTRIVIK